MAKFQNKHLKLRDNQRAYFGSSDDASLYFDGVEFVSTTTISGVTPTQDYHLTTKQYVDAAISGTGVTDHGALTGLLDDDHTQYIPVDGSRGFTSTVSGTTPVLTNDLATKGYIDGEISTVSSSIITDHGALGGLGDDDHTQYILVDGSRGFTATVSGVDPVADGDLATKFYVDNQTGGNHKSGREALALNDSSKAVTFASPYADTNYTVSVILTNTTDANPSLYLAMVSAKANTGFTILLSGDIDSNNYVLEWLAKHD